MENPCGLGLGLAGDVPGVFKQGTRRHMNGRRHPDRALEGQTTPAALDGPDGDFLELDALGNPTLELQLHPVRPEAGACVTWLTPSVAIRYRR
jgi:hypothetical protein